MAIGGITTSYSAGYKAGTIGVKTRGAGLTDRMGETASANRNSYERNMQGQTGAANQTTPMDAYTNMTKVSQKCSEMPALEDVLPMETERYVIRDASEMEGVPAYAIYDKQLGKGVYIREDQLAIQKDAASGFSFVIDMYQPLCGNVRVTDELKGLLDDLAQKRNLNLQEIPLQGGLTVNRDPKTGLNYLTFKGNEGKGASIIITSQKDIDTIESLVDEFMKYDVVRDRETARLWAVLEVSGNLKREENGFIVLTPDGMSYTPYDGNHRDAWNIKYSPLDYGAAREFLAKGKNVTDVRTWLQILPGAEILEPDVKPWDKFRINETSRGFQLNEDKSETKTDIIVKSDGSRVLVMTMSVGGMETTMSLLLSKPTSMQNESSDRNADHAEQSTGTDALSEFYEEGNVQT